MAQQRAFEPIPAMDPSTATARRGRWRGSALMQLVAAILLIAQLGIIAHRIEHYIAPDHMECGEDSCTAFAPTTGAAALPVFVPPIFALVFFLRFWALHDSAGRKPADRLGFRAQAPPV